MGSVAMSGYEIVKDDWPVGVREHDLTLGQLYEGLNMVDDRQSPATNIPDNPIQQPAAAEQGRSS